MDVERTLPAVANSCLREAGDDGPQLRLLKPERDVFPQNAAFAIGERKLFWPGGRPHPTFASHHKHARQPMLLAVGQKPTETKERLVLSQPMQVELCLDGYPACRKRTRPLAIERRQGRRFMCRNRPAVAVSLRGREGTALHGGRERLGSRPPSVLRRRWPDRDPATRLRGRKTVDGLRYALPKCLILVREMTERTPSRLRSQRFRLSCHSGAGNSRRSRP